jgi:protein tyrosine/serine phosphatase
MRYILRGHQIKTVIALAHTPDHPLVIQEKALARELGVRWVHIPIYYDSRQPANRREIADRLEQAAALIGDPAAQPVFFHCHHGVNRASMAQMAYRTLVCGWSLEQAKEEIARLTGWKQTEVGTGLEFMEAFYRNRVVPRRAAQASAPSSTQVAR